MIKKIVNYFSLILFVGLIFYLAYVYLYQVKINRTEAEQGGRRAVYDLLNKRFIVFNKNAASKIDELPKTSSEAHKDNITETKQPDVKQQTKSNDATNVTAAKQELPKINRDNLPKVSFLAMNLGLSESSSKMAFSLHPVVSIGISPYAANIPYWEHEFKNDGHEIYTELPLEPLDYKSDDKGFLALLSYNSAQQNFDNLNSILQKFTSLQGMYVNNKEKFTLNDKANQIFQTISSKNLKIIYTPPLMTQSKSLLSNSRINLLNENILYLDDELENEYIEKKLELLYSLAQQNGSALGIIRPYPISIKTVSNWIEEHKEDSKVNIVKTSEIIK